MARCCGIVKGSRMHFVGLVINEGVDVGLRALLKTTRSGDVGADLVSGMSLTRDTIAWFWRFKGVDVGAYSGF